MLSDGMDQILKMKFWPFCSDFWHTFDSRFFYNVSLWRSLFFGGASERHVTLQLHGLAAMSIGFKARRCCWGKDGQQKFKL